MKATGLMAAAAALALSPTPAAAQEVPIKVGILDAKGDRLVTPSDDVEVNYREFVTGNLISGRMKASVGWRSEEHTSELQSLMRISYAVFCLTKKNNKNVKKITLSSTQQAPDLNQITTN